MSGSDIVDKFLHHDSFSNSRSSKKSYFPSFKHRSKKVDDLDSCFEQFSFGSQRCEGRGFFVDGIPFLGFDIWGTVDSISEYIEHMSEHFWSDGYFDSISSICDGISSLESIS